MSNSGDRTSQDRGVGFPNVICYNGHGDSGQIMESMRLGGYRCQECGRTAQFTLEWSDPNE